MKTRVLFVEDEIRGAKPYFKQLESANFECVLAQDGDQAIKNLEQHQFNLLSMDIMFPPGKMLGENTTPVKAGLKLLQMIRAGKIKNCDPTIKVIILTAVINYEIEHQIKKLGVNAYLKKPIEFDKVIETFHELKNELEKANNV